VRVRWNIRRRHSQRIEERRDRGRCSVRRAQLGAVLHAVRGRLLPQGMN